MKYKSLKKASDKMDLIRKGIGRERKRGSVCNPKKVCLEKQKIPCDYFTEGKLDSEKQEILKRYKKVLPKFGLKSNKLGACQDCVKKPVHSSEGAFWVHLIRFHHKEVGVS